MTSVFRLVMAFCAGILLSALIILGGWPEGRLLFSPSLEFPDGSIYVGELNADGRVEGWGRLRWTNGDVYEGEFLDGLMHGQGTFTSGVAGAYRGGFVRGYREGRGTMIYPDGTGYEGDFLANHFHGRGRLSWSQGDYYDGEFVENRMTGYGERHFADGTLYVGQLVDGVFDGKGELRRATGEHYLGDFKAGKMHGRGIFTDAQQRQFSGEFSEDSFTGEGSFVSEEGFVYVGEFKDWRFAGKGLATDAAGNQWEGEYEQGQLKGEGRYRAASGEQYTGHFRFDQFDGEGTLRSATGEVYEGEFSFGRKHGKGVLTYPAPIDGISRIEGRWEYDRLVDGGEALKIFTPEEVTEHALYTDQTILQQALTAVRASDPQKIELYSLVVAGYGTEEVFRREGKFIEQLFARQYQNQATSIYLTNSQRSLTEHPLATRANIEAAIKRLAEQMDKQQDIFFLYITTHGSPDHWLALNHNGLPLRHIEARWLGDLLKATGIQHRVVVLSACYSGGLIEAIKDDHSLIMTAAAADKPSFGCADDSLMTYFGRAYFAESLQPGVDFEAAFHKAEALIARWEAEGDISPSEPQLVANARVKAQVQRWLQGLFPDTALDLDP